MKKGKVALMTGVIALATSASAFAGTSLEGYETTVGKFNGNGYTGYDHVKSVDGANGSLNSHYVGGSYKVDARMQDGAGNDGDWSRNLSDDTSHTLDGHKYHLEGDSMRVQFSNDFNTSVDVQVNGNWSSDN